jgi:hypothetical protein
MDEMSIQRLQSCVKIKRMPTIFLNDIMQQKMKSGQKNFTKKWKQKKLQMNLITQNKKFNEKQMNYVLR